MASGRQGMPSLEPFHGLFQDFPQTFTRALVRAALRDSRNNRCPAAQEGVILVTVELLENLAQRRLASRSSSIVPILRALRRVRQREDLYALELANLIFQKSSSRTRCDWSPPKPSRRLRASRSNWRTWSSSLVSTAPLASMIFKISDRLRSESESC